VEIYRLVQPHIPLINRLRADHLDSIRIAEENGLAKETTYLVPYLANSTDHLFNAKTVEVLKKCKTTDFRRALVLPQ